MRNKFLVVALVLTIGFSAIFVSHDVAARLICSPDPANPGEEICVPEGVSDPDDSADPDDPADPNAGGSGGNGYDACNNIYPGGHVPPGFCDEKGENDLIATVGNVLNAVYFWVAILAVIFIIIGGVYYTISQGDPGKVKKAKDTILYAVIGLVIALLAFGITQFVLNALKGA